MEQGIDQLLTDKKAEGQTLDEGAFSVCGSKALAKLGEYCLQDVDLWALKIVQAAVRAGSPTLDFKLGRRESSATFETLHEPLCLKRLSELVINPLQDDKNWMVELALALRSLSYHGRTVVVHCRDGTLICGADGMRLEESEFLNSYVKVVLHSPKSSIWSFFKAKKAASIATLLQTKAVFAPLELTIDSRRVTGSYEPVSDYKRSWHAVASPCKLLGCSYHLEPEPELGTEIIMGEESTLRDRLSSSETFLSLRIPDRPHSHNFELFVSYQDPPKSPVTRRILREKFRVVFTRFGVEAKVLPFGDSQLGGVLQVAADGATTDLSGIDIRLGDKERDSLQRALEVVEPSIDQMSELVRLHNPKRALIGWSTQTDKPEMIFRLVQAARQFKLHTWDKVKEANKSP